VTNFSPDSRPRIVVATTGDARRRDEAGRYAALGATSELRVVRLGRVGEPTRNEPSASPFGEIIVPRSTQHLQSERILQQSIEFDVSRASLGTLLPASPAYLAALQEAAADSDVCIVSDATLLPAVRAYVRLPTIYDAPCVESLAPGLLEDRPEWQRTLVSFPSRAEREALAWIDAVIARCDEDRDAFTQRTSAPVVVVPPVLEDDPRRLRTPLERERAKAERGLAGKRIGIYVGTGTVANVAAMLALPTLSGGVDALLIVGNVARNVIGDALPRPLRITGEVSEDELDALLGLADVALEPTSTGNGISRKVIAYVRAGVPVVTTPAGLRGLPLAPERDVLCGPLDAFPQLIARTFADPAAAQARAARAKGALLAAFTPDAARLRFERMLRDVFQH
jgi:glycosyltransferase involved in cell wall biosynthesis